ncbi:MAG: GAF domain-containing sensor histidine kinase, partial [Pyrinomonadaceae bacterium]
YKLQLPSFDMPHRLSARIHYEDRTAGLLVVCYSQLPDSWPGPANSVLLTISRQTAVLCRSFEQRGKLTRLVEFLQEISEKTTARDLYDLVLREGRALLNCDRGVVRRVNLENGFLNYALSSPPAPVGFGLPHGEGITGLALKAERTYRIDDVTVPEWQPIYRPLWPNLPRTRTTLAVPILLRRSRVRVKTHNEFVDKPFGVLSFESPTTAAFSSLDQYCAENLAQRMAAVLERIEYDEKLGKLRRASQSLALRRDWDSIVDTLLEAIRDALGYEFVSLSIVDQDAEMIRCVRVIGLPEAEASEFRRAFVQRMNSNHVQADVVRYGQTEVLSRDDDRLDEISKLFGLDRLIRVFVPMKVSSRNEVIGTISAGYDRTYREHIYWRDIQLLRILTAFGANAMESWQRGNVDRVTHEMNAPLTAVRAQLEMLRAKHRVLSDEQIELALEDMQSDSQLLYYQVQQLEYVLGGPASDSVKQPLNTEPVLLFRDIIFKTMHQLKQLVRDRGLDPKKVSYSEEAVYKIKSINVDKSKINQVIFNLFVNAIKYAESPETFQIRIGADEVQDHYVIKFCDWGIGIPEGLEEKIFEHRFRAPVVQDRAVKGSGLGLTISRQIMREHGGDLVLKNRHNPTEFHLVFPKQLRRRHEDNVH